MPAVRRATLAATSLAAALLALSGCASFEPEPCTAEWLQWKKDRVYSSYKRDHRREIDALRDLSRSFDRNGAMELSMGDIARVTPAVMALVSDFLEVSVPEIQSAVAQCGAPPRAAQLFADMLRQEGVDERTLATIERFGGALDMDR